MLPHFIYCGSYYFSHDEKLRKMFLTKMKKYGIQSSILTRLYMRRRNLVTEEKVIKAYKGDEDWKYYTGSINDDLEGFISNLRDQKEVKNEFVQNFFTPKLKNVELKLVQEGNKEYLGSYFHKNPDVDGKEMDKSESKSKYVYARCRRWTIPLNIDAIDDNKTK